jgi:hypothetical protein
MRLLVASVADGLFAGGRVVRNVMAGQILTLPIRLGVRAATLCLRTGEEIATRTLALAVQAAGVMRSSRDEDHGSSPAPPSDPVPETAAPAAFTGQTTAQDGDRGGVRDVEIGARGAEIDFDAPEEPAPPHVSEEPALAAEIAEPGAEDGAGAAVRVDEPWPGYRALNAKDVVARIASADAAELAAIQLFESSHQRRQTVLSAVERQLRLASHNS